MMACSRPDEIMDSVIVAIPNDETLAAELGKKGSQNGITYYNRKAGEAAVVIMTPTDAVSKFYAVAEIMSMADVAVISTSNMDPLLGESIIMASMLGKKTIFTKENDISGILKSVSIEGCEFSERKELVEKLVAFRRDHSSKAEELRIDIDKSFPVKGVGTVLLGIVRSGTVNVHDSLKSSGGKDISVRSIQVHDEDQQHASAGDRVGIAAKGIDYIDVEKGDVLSKEKKPYVASISANIKKSQMLKDLELDGLSCTLVSGFLAVNCRLTKTEETFSIKLEKPSALWKGDSFLLIREKSPKAVGAGSVI